MAQPVPTEFIAEAWLEREQSARHLPRSCRAILVPDLVAEAASWWDGGGAWAGTPRLGEWPDFAGAPLVGVTDNGEQSKAIVAVEVRKIARKDYRGKNVLVVPWMAEVRIHKLWGRLGRSGGPGGTLEAVLPYALGGAGPRRADRRPDAEGLNKAVALLLSLAGDPLRRWEALRAGGGRPLEVASASGRAAAEGPPPPLSGDHAAAATAFDPANSRGEKP